VHNCATYPKARNVEFDSDNSWPVLDRLMTTLLAEMILPVTRFTRGKWLKSVILTAKTGPGMTQKLAWAHLRPARFRPASEDQWLKSFEAKCISNPSAGFV